MLEYDRISVSEGILFGIKSVLILKKNLMANLSAIKKILKIKIKSYGDEARDFHDREIPKAGSNHTCLEVITIDSVYKKHENYYSQVFLKQWKWK